MDILHNISSFFGKEPVVGLDIGEDYLSAASVFPEKEGKTFNIEQLAWTKIKSQSTRAEKALALKRLWQQQRIKTHTVCSCLRSPSLALKYFSYPGLTDRELKSALLLDAEQIFQRPRQEIVIDWYLFPFSATNTKEGILACVPQEEVNEHLALLQLAELYPLALDIGCMAVSNLFKNIHKDKWSERPLALISVNKRSADLAVLGRDSFICPRTIYSPRDSWQQKLTYLSNSIEDLLRYHQFKLRQTPVEKLFITGVLAADENFRAQLAHELGLQLELWNPLQYLKAAQQTTPDQAQVLGPLAATCLGLALYKEGKNGLSG